MRIVYDGGTGETLTVHLAGDVTNIDAAQVDEIASYLDRAAPYNGWQVDVTAVRAIDPSGVALLTRIMDWGVAAGATPQLVGWNSGRLGQLDDIDCPSGLGREGNPLLAYVN